MNNFGGKKIHMIGIKGVGMTALAEILLASGAILTGSDTEEEFHTDRVLKRLRVVPGHFSPSNITPKLDLVIYSSAYDADNVERKKAKELGIKQMSYADALSAIFNRKKGIMVAGSHGKTTTTALLAHIMVAAGFDPTVVVGGTVIAWDSNVRLGKSEWMLAEGDEYQEKFLQFKPHYLLITNIDYDHPDTFSDKKSYSEAFEKLAGGTAKKVISHETMGQANVKNIEKFVPDSLLGKHNKMNLALVLALSRELGITEDQIKAGLGGFKGVRRRMEIYFQDDDLVIMDDYAHHPAEISATLEAVKNKWPEREVITIFQPHTFSRTKALMSDFALAFEHADEVYLIPTYSSARETAKNGAAVDENLYENISKHKVLTFKGFPAEKKLMAKKRPMVVLTMGAGDLWQFAKKFAEKYESAKKGFF